MPMPIVNHECCEAVLQKMCHDHEGGPAHFGVKFMSQFSEDQPALLDAIMQAMSGYIVPKYGEDTEEAAEVCGATLVILGFMWKTIEAAVEAQDLEDAIG